MRTSKSAPALGQIGHLIPRLLLAVGLLDLGLRFIPVEPLTFRASEEPNPDPDRIVSMARRLGMPRGLVIHLYSEDRDLPRIPASRKRRVTAVLASMPPSLAGFVGWVRGLATVSPLQIGSERAMKAIEDGKILPNSYAGRVVRRTLENGDAILFRAAHVED